MDIVCVFCARDLAPLRLQARSIARYFDRRGLGRVIYVWNDTAEMGEGLLREVRDCLEGIELQLVSWASFGVQLHEVDADGWTTQQALKLLTARVAAEEQYLVLDAKNHFLWPCSANDFLTEDGRGKALLEDIGRNESFRYCLKYFGVHFDRQSFEGLPNVTPFVLHTALVRRMLTSLEESEARTIAATFIAHEYGLTEFMAYQAYALWEGQEIGDLYQAQKLGVAENMWGSTVRSSGRFERCIERLKSGDTRILGLHWMACCLLTTHQRDVLCKFWTARELTQSAEEGVAIINAVMDGLRDGDVRFLQRWLRAAGN